MQRVTENGATVDNRYTEGNAALSIPATIVGENEMNSIQEEICNVIEGAGLVVQTAPLVDSETQLLQAIQLLIGLGGTITPINQAIVNNQASPAPVVGFPAINKNITQVVEALYSVYRKTDSENYLESGRMYLGWNPATSAWVVSKLQVFEDAGMTLSMIVDGGDPNIYHLNYQSDSVAGSSYSGNLRITDIKRIQF